ncbi:MAG: hypothetical protein ACI4MZ_03120, partial [Christensenellales bacterium]
FALLDFYSCYRAENLRYQTIHGQALSSQFRQIVGLLSFSTLIAKATTSPCRAKSFALLDFYSCYRAENLRYHTIHGQVHSPQFRQIVGLLSFAPLIAKATTSPCRAKSFALLDFYSCYRAENLRYQTIHGQALSPQFRQIVGLLLLRLMADFHAEKAWI